MLWVEAKFDSNRSDLVLFDETGAISVEKFENHAVHFQIIHTRQRFWLLHHLLLLRLQAWVHVDSRWPRTYVGQVFDRLTLRLIILELRLV